MNENPKNQEGPSQLRTELHSEVTSPEKVSDKPQNKENPVQEADVPAYVSYNETWALKII